METTTSSDVPQAHPRRLSGDERRTQLIETAATLFARHGFVATTTREIAKAAGVSEAIIFRFFPNKEDLYAAILECKSSAACTDTWVEELVAAEAAGDDEAVVRSLVRHFIEHQRRDPQFLRLMLHSALEDHSFAREFRARHFAPVRRFLEEFVAAGQRDGRFRAGDPRAVVRAILGVPFHHSLAETLLPNADGSFGDDSIDLYTAFVLGGLRTQSPAAHRPTGKRSSVR